MPPKNKVTRPSPASQDVHLDRDEVLELAQVMDEDGEGSEGDQIMGPAEIDAAMAELDPGGDGEITFEQFYTWWEKREGLSASSGGSNSQNSGLPGAVYQIHDEAEDAKGKDTEGGQLGGDATQSLNHSSTKPKLGCCARLKICLRRCVETEVRGARLPELMGILAAFLAPVADVSSDWAVVHGFHRDCTVFNSMYDATTQQARFAAAGGSVESPCTWRNLGLYTMILGGFFSAAFLFVRMVKLGGRYAVAALPAAALSLVGLAPVFHAALALMLQDPKGGKATLKVAKGIELIFEAIPQSSLQAYVLVIDDRLSWANDTKWDPMLGLSVLISFFGAGTTLFGFEASARQGGYKLPEFAAFSRYGLMVSIARAVQIAAMVFGVALVGCAGSEVHGASFVILVIICTLGVYFYEPTQLRNSMSAWAALALYVVGVLILRLSFMQLRDSDGVIGTQECSRHSDCEAGLYCDLKEGCSSCEAVDQAICEGSDAECCSPDFLANCPKQDYPGPMDSCLNISDSTTGSSLNVSNAVHVSVRSDNLLKMSSSCSINSTCVCNMTVLNVTKHSRLGDANWRPIDGACCGESVWDTAQLLLSGLGVILVALMNCIDPAIGLSLLHAKSHAAKVARDAAKAGLTADQIDQAKVEQVWNWIDYFADGQIEPQEIYRLAQRVIPLGGPPAERFGHYKQLCEKLSIPALTWPEFQANKKSGAIPAGGLDKFCITKEQFITRYRGGVGSEIFDALELPLLKAQGIRGILGC